MNNQSSIYKLFVKYLEDNCTPEEIRQLLLYFDDGENEKVLRVLIRAELGFVENDKDSAGKTETAVNKVKSIIIKEIRDRSAHESKSRKNYSIKKWLKIAALWLVLMSSTLLLFNQYIKERNKSRNLKQLLHLSTQPGEKQMLQLYDGTKIWLSPSSSLEYQDQLIGNYREVKLEGEAFFEVAKDKKHPFIIHTGQVQTEVVGTSFNIRAFKQNKVTVTVVTGIVKVSVWSATNLKIKQVTLKPNQSADFTKETRTLKTNSVPNIQTEIKRKDGILTYNGTPVPEVIANFRRYYNLSIELENKSAQCLCYGEFDTTKPINIVLDQLAAAINAKVVYKNERYILQGGCDDH
ncbi:FecR family protein [Mucilaginibacter flavidus]|uniref:FecR family protein n=1 Tax=Mucilaginibacter flavidus TaxID=2949309 RepID=UPI0020923110|nr:FecR domain-containing protein [Mucilaginibacter flavidus]